jgi:D-beta-D-heptose 7-phosphate kinase/D-beta-D-heptose 1-phosphate adenosyltransferase
MLRTEAVTKLLEAAQGRTIVVLGDLMLDEWIIGTASRISPESPVPVVRFNERKTAPGGAANVVMNLLRLGAKVRVCGVVGNDEAGDDLTRELQEAGADVRGIVRDPERPTTLKTRVVAQRQQMVRIDRESDATLSPEIRLTLGKILPELLQDASLLCISDYDKGLATCGIVTYAVVSAHERGVKVSGGPKPQNLSCFAGADFLSLNQKEASEAAGYKLENDGAIERAGTALLDDVRSGALAITRSAKGVALFAKDAAPLHLEAHAVEVFDVAGAGDTFLAAASLAVAAGSDWVQATELGNLAAAASVRHVGVVAVTPEEVCRVAAE